MFRLILAALVLIAQPVAAQAQPAGLTPLEFGRLVNSPEFRPHRERAVQLMATLWEPGLPVDDKWYRDIRTETLALLLYYRWIGDVGATATIPDARCSAVDTRWPGLIDQLKK